MIWRIPAAALLAATIGFLVWSPTSDSEPDRRTPVGVTQIAPLIDDSITVSATPTDTDTALAYRPVGLRIPRLSVDSPVNLVGMADESTMEIPEDITVVGWFRYGALVGSDEGTAVFVGHRDGTSDPNGVFRNLSDLEFGDEIHIRDAAGTVWMYAVEKIELLNKQEFTARAPSIFVNNGPARVVLITCGGAYDGSRGGYQSNVMVTAHPA